MLQLSKTKRDILNLWNCATKQKRGGQEASRATNQQSTHDVRHWNSQVSTVESSKGSTLWKLCRIAKTLKQARDYFDSAKEHNYGIIVERFLEDEQYQMRMHEQGYTQFDMEDFDRMANEERNYVASSTERATP